MNKYILEFDEKTNNGEVIHLEISKQDAEELVFELITFIQNENRKEDT